MTHPQNEAAFPEIDPERKRQIRELASEIWHLHFNNQIPVPVERLAMRDRRLRLEFDDFDDRFEGATGALPEGRFLILMNWAKMKSGGERRSRFTLAHELGHVNIKEHAEALVAGKKPRVKDYPRGLGELLAEHEAHYFASVFLIPDEAFWSAIDSAPPGFAGIKKIAQRFNVSWRAAAIRCVQATKLRCVLVVFSATRKTWICVSELAKTDWGLSRQSRLRQLETPDVFRGKTKLGDWFHDVPENLAPMILFQETRKLGKTGELGDGTVILLSEQGDWRGGAGLFIAPDSR